MIPLILQICIASSTFKASPSSWASGVWLCSHHSSLTHELIHFDAALQYPKWPGHNLPLLHLHQHRETALSNPIWVSHQNLRCMAYGKHQASLPGPAVHHDTDGDDDSTMCPNGLSDNMQHDNEHIYIDP